MFPVLHTAAGEVVGLFMNIPFGVVRLLFCVPPFGTHVKNGLTSPVEPRRLCVALVGCAVPDVVVVLSDAGDRDVTTIDVDSGCAVTGETSSLLHRWHHESLDIKHEHILLSS